MRQVLNISVPQKTAMDIRKATKKGGYTSISEFIRAIYRDWEEYRLYKTLIKGKKEIESGKGYTLDSLKDLR